MQKRLDKSICPWWDGPCLFEALDATDIPQRDPEGSFRCDSLSMFLVFFYPRMLYFANCFHASVLLCLLLIVS
jgi:hypothetical protein